MSETIQSPEQKQQQPTPDKPKVRKEFLFPDDTDTAYVASVHDDSYHSFTLHDGADSACVSVYIPRDREGVEGAMAFVSKLAQHVALFVQGVQQACSEITRELLEEERRSESESGDGQTDADSSV